MCSISAPETPQVPDRQSARAPDGGDATVRTADRARRRIAMAASIFSPQGNTLGAPAVSGALKGSLGGA